MRKIKILFCVLFSAICAANMAHAKVVMPFDSSSLQPMPRDVYPNISRNIHATTTKVTDVQHRATQTQSSATGSSTTTTTEEMPTQTQTLSQEKTSYLKTIVFACFSIFTAVVAAFFVWKAELINLIRQSVNRRDDSNSQKSDDDTNDDHNYRF